MKTVASLGEFGLIEKLFAAKMAPAEAGVALGIGDDAAVLTLPRTQHLVATTDTMVEGIHFLSDADPYLLGRKLLRVNLSDCAAMGAIPRWALLSLTLPPATSLTWAEEFARGLLEECERFGVQLVGGDTVASKGCTTLTITLLGMVSPERAIRRSGARPGDLIFVTGTIGDSALGLAMRLGNLRVADANEAEYLKIRHHLPEPRVAFGQLLQESCLAHAAIDVSDGLAADLKRMCLASGVGARVDAARVPLSNAARRQVLLHGDQMVTTLLTGGEDYELILAVPPGAAQQLRETAERVQLPVTEVGVFLEGDAVEFQLNETTLHLGRGGWVHF